MPEGAEGVNFKSNVELVRGEDSNRYTFLDTSGRVVVSTSGGRVTSDHQAKITLTYNWNSVLIFKVILINLGKIAFITIIFIRGSPFGGPGLARVK